MVKDYIGYQALADNAMRGIVREALRFVERNNGVLVGGHHFYISFKTQFPGVDIPDFLKEQYPNEITIVLENQFSGLSAKDDDFEVTLNFRKVPAALHVPYAALTSFVDKGANFGLQFHSGANSESSEAAGGAKVEVLSQPITDKSAPQATDAAADEPHRDAEVVSLDKFRKK